FRGIFGTKTQKYAKRFSAKTPIHDYDDYSRSVGEGLYGVRKKSETIRLNTELEASKQPATMKANEDLYLAREKDDIASLPKDVQAEYTKSLEPVFKENDKVFDD